MRPTMSPSTACSSSTSVPQKSFGCRKSTGLPCAPIFGSPPPRTRAPAATSRPQAARVAATSYPTGGGGGDVVDLVADVVDAALRAALEEARDRRALAEGLEELDLGVRQRDED